MNHLGRDVSALVDGQLPPEEVERVASHLLRCDRCADLVAAERASRRALAEARDVQPSADLTERLLAVARSDGGPHGAAQRWAGPQVLSDRRARRRALVRGTVALGGVATVLVALVVVGALSERSRDPGHMLAEVRAGLRSTATPAQASLSRPAVPEAGTEEVLAWMSRSGWCSPDQIPGAVRVSDVAVLPGDGGPVLQVDLLGGGHHVRLIEQPGRLAPAALEGLEPVELDGATAHRLPGAGVRLVVQCDDTVVMVVADTDVALDVAGELPVAPYGTGVVERIDRGWSTLVDWTAGVAGASR